MNRLLLITCALASLVVQGASYVAVAQEPATLPAAAPAMAPHDAAPDAEFDQLARDFQTLYESLRNMGGISDDAREVVRSMRERAAAFSAAHPDDARGLAIELQTSLWLEDDERVADLYEQLIRLRPEMAQLRLGFANYLKQQNQYDRMLEALRGGDVEFDPAETPEAFVALSEALFAEHHFQEALDALEAIPADALADDPYVKFQVDQARTSRREYVDLWEQEKAIRAQEEAADDLPRAMIVTEKGPITVELFEDSAPNTVANFISLADQGFYNGTTFHRVIANFMAQGGDPNTKEGSTAGAPGTGNPGYYIPDETERENPRKHFSGSLSMAKTDAPNTGGSQFFITHQPTPDLNGKHTVFGRVLSGLDVARQLEQDDRIEAITVLRKRDHDYTPATLPLPESARPPATVPSIDETPATAPATSPATEPQAETLPSEPADSPDEQPETTNQRRS